MATIQKQNKTETSTDKDVEKLEPVSPAGGNVKASMESNRAGPQTLEN